MRFLIDIIAIPFTLVLEAISIASPKLSYLIAHRSILSSSLDRDLGRRLW